MGLLQKLLHRKMCSNIELEHGNIEICIGDYRRLEKDEKTGNYVYVVTAEYVYTDSNGRQVKVPVQFLTDGASGPAPDWGHGWIFHDWLYSTHKFSTGEECSRREADDVMCDVLKAEKLRLYRIIYKILVRTNPFCIFSRAWKKSGKRGPEYLDEN